MSDPLVSIGAGGLLYALGACVLLRDRYRRDIAAASGLIVFGVCFFAWLAIRLFHGGGCR